jgi:hypothetical protein
METIDAHIVTNPNAIAMNFHHKTKADSLLMSYYSSHEIVVIG